MDLFAECDDKHLKDVLKWIKYQITLLLKLVSASFLIRQQGIILMEVAWYHIISL